MYIQPYYVGIGRYSVYRLARESSGEDEKNTAALLAPHLNWYSKLSLLCNNYLGNRNHSWETISYLSDQYQKWDVHRQE